MRNRRGIMLPTVMMLTTLILLFVVFSFSITFNDDIATAVAVDSEGAKMAAKSGLQAALIDIERKIAISKDIPDAEKILGYEGSVGWSPCTRFNSPGNPQAEFCYAYEKNVIVAGGRVKGKKGWLTRYLKTAYFIESCGVAAEKVVYKKAITNQNKNITGIDGRMVQARDSQIKESQQKKRSAFIKAFYSAKAPFPLDSWIALSGGGNEHSSIEFRVKYTGDIVQVKEHTIVSDLNKQFDEWDTGRQLLLGLDLASSDWGKGSSRKNHLVVRGAETSAWDNVYRLVTAPLLSDALKLKALKNLNGLRQLVEVTRDYHDIHKELSLHEGDFLSPEKLRNKALDITIEKIAYDKAYIKLRKKILNDFKKKCKEEYRNGTIKVSNNIRGGISGSIGDLKKFPVTDDGYSAFIWDLFSTTFEDEVKSFLGEDLDLSDFSHAPMVIKPEGGVLVLKKDKGTGNEGSKYFWFYPRRDCLAVDGDILLQDDVTLVTTGNLVVNGNIRGNGIVISLGNIYFTPVNKDKDSYLSFDDKVILYAAKNVFIVNDYKYHGPKIGSKFDPFLCATMPPEMWVKISEYCRSNPSAVANQEIHTILQQYCTLYPDEVPDSFKKIYCGTAEPPESEISLGAAGINGDIGSGSGSDPESGSGSGSSSESGSGSGSGAPEGAPEQ